MATTPIQVGPEIHARLKAECLRRNVTIRQATEAAIDAWLDDPPDGPLVQSRPPRPPKTPPACEEQIRPAPKSAPVIVAKAERLAEAKYVSPKVIAKAQKVLQPATSLSSVFSSLPTSRPVDLSKPQTKS
jgi:hypothetical protein